MRGRWKFPTTTQAPLTATLIALSILVTLVGGFGKASKGIGGTVNQELMFVRRSDFEAAPGYALASLAKGEMWRAITPIFIHLAPVHLLFNMIMFFQFARVIEARRGTARFAFGVLVIAEFSNIAQAVAPDWLGGSPFFGGMSGVVYGLFGYAWMQSRFDATSGFYLSPANVTIMLGWLFLCMTGVVGNIANVAHVVGLLVGVAFGFLPTLWKE